MYGLWEEKEEGGGVMPTGIYERHKRPEILCSVEGCSNKHYAKGLCRKHWSKQYNRQYEETHKEQIKQYRQNNKEKKRDYMKQYRQDNKGEIARYKKLYEEIYKERKVEWNKRYFQTHKEQMAKSLKQWRRTHKEKCSEYSKRYRQSPKGRISGKANNHSLTVEEVKNIYEANISKYGRLTCILCNKTIEFGEDSLEHKIPLSRGGANDCKNIGVAHLNCNRKKNKMTLEEWQALKK